MYFCRFTFNQLQSVVLCVHSADRVVAVGKVNSLADVCIMLLITFDVNISMLLTSFDVNMSEKMNTASISISLRRSLLAVRQSTTTN